MSAENFCVSEMGKAPSSFSAAGLTPEVVQQLYTNLQSSLEILDKLRSCSPVEGAVLLEAKRTDTGWMMEIPAELVKDKVVIQPSFGNEETILKLQGEVADLTDRLDRAIQDRAGLLKDKQIWQSEMAQIRNLLLPYLRGYEPEKNLLECLIHVLRRHDKLISMVRSELINTKKYANLDGLDLLCTACEKREA